MITTLTDVAQELNVSYFRAKRSNLKSNNIFIAILNHLFEVYGEHFGYSRSQFPLFKGDILEIRKRLKKSEKIARGENDYIKKESFWRKAKMMETVFNPQEGDGEIFTDKQIDRDNLDRDQYFPSFLKY